MEKKGSIADKTVRNSAVKDVIREQVGNFSQNLSRKKDPNDPLAKFFTRFVRECVKLALIKPAPLPNMDSSDWKNDFVNGVKQALVDAGYGELLETTMKDCASIFHEVDKGTANDKYFYNKICIYSGQVATMFCYNLDPDLLRMTQEESDMSLINKIREAKGKGIPVVVHTD